MIVVLKPLMSDGDPVEGLVLFQATRYPDITSHGCREEIVSPSVEKTEVPWPGPSPDPNLLDDVIDLLSRVMLTHLLAISHHYMCC